jgi:TP901 family phage tail tape measure protein
MAKKRIDLSKIFDHKIANIFADAIKRVVTQNKKAANSMDKVAESTKKAAKAQKDLTQQIIAAKGSSDQIKRTFTAADQLEKQYLDLVKAQTQLNNTNKELKSSYTALEKTYKQQLEILKNLSSAQDPTKYKQQVKVVAELQAQMKQWTDQLNKNAKAVGTFNNMYKMTNLQLERKRQLLKTLVIGWDKHGNAIFKNSSQARTLLKDIKNLNQRLVKFDKTIGQNYRSVGQMGTKLKGLAGSFSFVVLGIAGTTMALNEMFEAFTAVEFKLAQVAGLSEATAEQFERLEENALMLGRTTARTAADIAELQLKLTKMGFDPDQILKMTKSITQLSIAFDEDLGVTAKTVAASLRAFQLEADQTDRVTNALGKAFAESSLDLDAWRTAIGFVGPQAKTLGVDIETTIALLGRLANAGLNASTAATALRGLFAKMADPTAKLNKLIGFQIENSEDLLDVFQDLAEKGYTELSEAAQLTSLRQQAAFITLGKTADETRKLAETLRQSGDFLDNFSEGIEHTAAIKIKELVSALQGLGIAMMNVLGRPLKAVIDSITWAFRQLGDLIDHVRKDTTLFGEEFMTIEERRSLKQDEFLTGLIKEKKVLHDLFQELKDQQLTQEARLAIIKQINEQYGRYLPNLLDEESSLDEINKAYKRINEQMMLKAILTAEEEEIMKAMKDWVTAMSARISQERESKKAYDDSVTSLEKYKEKMDEIRETLAGEGKTKLVKDAGLLIERLRQGDKAIAEMTKESERLKKEWEFHRDVAFDIDSIVGGIREQYDQMKKILDVTNAQIQEEERQRRHIKGHIQKSNELIIERVSMYESLIDRTDQFLKMLKDAQRLEKATTLMGIQKAYSSGQIGYRKFLQQITEAEDELNTKHLIEQKKAVEVMIAIREEGLRHISGLEQDYQNVQEELRIAQQNNLNDKQLKIDAEFLRDEIDMRREAGMEIVDLQADLAELELDIEENKNKRKEAMQKRMMTQTREFTMRAINELISALTALQDAEFAQRKDVLKKREQEMMDFYDREIQMAGDNARWVASLEEQKAQAQKDIKRQMAELDKEAALSKARIDIALSMIRTIAQYGFPLGPVFAAIVGAIGQIQLQAIKATPIPTYGKGTEHAKGN